VKFILIILLSISALGCTTIKNSYRDQILETELSNKTIKDLLSILKDGHVGFIAEPPCFLSSIYILSADKLVIVDLEINNIPTELRENTITCRWQVENFYQYYPSKIKVRKIDQNYIEKLNRPFNK
jgi:hypothetical protein